MLFKVLRSSGFESAILAEVRFQTGVYVVNVSLHVSGFRGLVVTMLTLVGHALDGHQPVHPGPEVHLPIFHLSLFLSPFPLLLLTFAVLNVYVFGFYSKILTQPL